MGSGYWRTDKRIEPFKLGKTTNERVEEYIKTWKGRCYYSDIPDEVPEKIMRSGRAPSYKAIALAILKNDLQLFALGFAAKESEWYQALRIEKAREQSKQYDLFSALD
jgi:predicted phosphoadenosine phosphosulfate sulfurtransferase